jgi:preprotein translocase subunit SecG
MQSVLIAIQLLVSIALVAVVLLQRSEGGALGMGGGGGSGLGGLFSPRGAADTLTRTTAVLAILFFLTSLALTLLALHGRSESFIQSQTNAPLSTSSLLKTLPHPAQPKVPSVPLPH